MIVETLEVLLNAIRVVAFGVGFVTIYNVYRAPEGRPIRRNAGRISAAIVLWLLSVVLKLTLGSAEDWLMVSRLVINLAGIVFCAAFWGIARAEAA
jgi:hypothetical protein